MESILKCNSELNSEKDLKVGMALTIPDPSDAVIPVEDEVTETHTLIVHGSNNFHPRTEATVNTMTVGGRTITVPAYKPPQAAVTSAAGSSYRSKYHGMSSRGMLPGVAVGNAIVKSAFRFMGVPYVFGGTTPSGFDCSGFVQYVYNINGIKTPRMAHHQYYAGTPISRSQLRPGDLVFFETYTVGISHVGIYIGDNKFIHASSQGGVRVNSLDQDYYRNRYRGAARY